MEIRTEADLYQLIATGARETIHLEFKDGRAIKNTDPVKNEIAKDVSAFANSDGGVIVYGLLERDHVAAQITPLDGSKFTEEWLEQVINSNIERRLPPDFRIHRILIGQSPTDTVYIVKIPRSSLAPHMTPTNRYYRRYNFESVPMEEYEVRDLYHRANLTNLEIEELRPSITSLHSETFLYEFPFSIMNTGFGYELYYKLVIETELEFDDMNGFIKESYNVDHYRKMFKYVISNQNPIFQNEPIKVIIGRILLNREKILLFSGGEIIVTLYYSSGSKVKIFPFKPFAQRVIQDMR